MLKAVLPFQSKMVLKGAIKENFIAQFLAWEGEIYEEKTKMVYSK